MPWSLGATNDDKIASSVSALIGVDIVISEKMDGSNASLERSGCFARSHSGSPTHESFDGLKVLHGQVGYKIPDNLQLFGEWCFAKHSIEYSELPNYFLLFAVRDLSTEPVWLDWDSVELWADEISVHTVPTLFKGILSSEDSLQKLVKSFMIEPSLCGGNREGVVARVAGSFPNDEFSSKVLKCVRENHVTSDSHWKHQQIIRNSLK